jgi:hypothetical protein
MKTDEKIEIIDEYFDRTIRHGNIYLIRKSDRVEFPLYMFSFYDKKTILEVATGERTPEFLID